MLDRIIAPVTVDEFLSEYWGRKFSFIPGPIDKFSHLYPWEVLSRVLETGMFRENTLRLVKSGDYLEQSAFLKNSRVDSSKLIHALAGGATLILNACEDVHPPLKDVCIALEQLFHVRVHTNLYAAWSRDNGFKTHWDDQNTLILQVAGRKSWKVWEPTLKNPVKLPGVPTLSHPEPSDPPVWEGILEQGSMLAIPRGWWHLVCPVDEPSLHLTVTVKNHTGLDFLQWFGTYMSGSEHARSDVPIPATPQQRLLWMEALINDLNSTWTDKVFSDFIAAMDATAQARPSIHLPSDVSSVHLPLDSRTRIELAFPRPLQFELTGAGAQCNANGAVWKATPAAAARIEILNDCRPHTMSELSAGIGFQVSSVVMAMVIGGVLRRLPE